MIIYIPLEIPVRELPGYLLLATIAASRGHQTCILPPNQLFLLSKLGLLNPGCLLVKNLNVPTNSEVVYRNFVDAGFDIYCQEQEPPILRYDIDRHIFDYNINPEQYFPFKKVFCYGRADTNAYRALFGGKGNIFVATGSPRLDMWAPNFMSAWSTNPLENGRPYLLVVSNFSYLMGRYHMAQFLAVQASMGQLDTFDREERMTHCLEEDFGVALSMILAIKYLALNHTGFDIIVRPHPNDSISNWKKLFERYGNVKVSGNIDSITPWIAGASAVIQNGCTSALEAVIQRVPIISYGPDRGCSGLTIPNDLGVRAKTLEELNKAIEIVQRNEYYDIYQKKSEEVLEPILRLNGNSAIEMVMHMESESYQLKGNKLGVGNIMKISSAQLGKQSYDAFRRRLKIKNVAYDKAQVPPSLAAVRQVCANIASSLDLQAPKVTKIWKHGIFVHGK